MYLIQTHYAVSKSIVGTALGNNNSNINMIIGPNGVTTNQINRNPHAPAGS